MRCFLCVHLFFSSFLRLGARTTQFRSNAMGSSRHAGLDRHPRHGGFSPNLRQLSNMFLSLKPSRLQVQRHRTRHAAGSRLVRCHKRTGRRKAPSMCICINCKLVDNCTAYRYVESMHKQPFVGDVPAFTPRDGSPTIDCNIRTTGSYTENNMETEMELDVVECEDFVSEPGRWVKMMPKDTLLKAGLAADFVPT
mmetsp:Transcript_23054/g.36817  ORF Transcript_23054/g.36817 Transcript_23054/m.36817 type:complete len:195 (+) Transcript_23054:49-633(+)